MSKGRTRFVSQEWVRDPNGKLLEKPPPAGMRTPNNIIWGHTLADFFWIPRIPCMNVLTIWSRSMIRALGASENPEGVSHPEEPPPRRLRPYPVLALPPGVTPPPGVELGRVDEGCGAPVRQVEELESTARKRSALMHFSFEVF
ncbi:hypothetical protein B0H10DRAFT_1211847 [Mycena sp. CBHHK59/15]|nr:hypothetical protein B0H10DRAFT_1211847 [Mycena sp. CBHHK59/15]